MMVITPKDGTITFSVKNNTMPCPGGITLDYLDWAHSLNTDVPPGSVPSPSYTQTFDTGLPFLNGAPGFQVVDPGPTGFADCTYDVKPSFANVLQKNFLDIPNSFNGEVEDFMANLIANADTSTNANLNQIPASPTISYNNQSCSVPWSNGSYTSPTTCSGTWDTTIPQVDSFTPDFDVDSNYGNFIQNATFYYAAMDGKGTFFQKQWNNGTWIVQSAVAGTDAAALALLAQSYAFVVGGVLPADQQGYGTMTASVEGFEYRMTGVTTDGPINVSSAVKNQATLFTETEQDFSGVFFIQVPSAPNTPTNPFAMQYPDPTKPDANWKFPPFLSRIPFYNYSFTFPNFNLPSFNVKAPPVVTVTQSQSNTGS